MARTASFVLSVLLLAPAIAAPQNAERSRTQGLKETDRFVKAGGSTVEAVTATALRDAAARTADPADREHVTPYLRRARSGFKCLILPAPAAVRRPDLRFTVDTAADLAYMRRVLRGGGATGGRVVPLAELIAAADRLAAQQEVA